MKKIILGCLMMVALFTTVNVKAQTSTSTSTTTRVKYWYYPSSNVYYNDATGDYWYYDTPTTTWMDVKTLPTTYTITSTTPKYEVWYDGTDVWKDNAKHLKKYKVKKNGRTKMKEHKDM